MVFIDKIYLAIYKAYKDRFKDNTPEVYGIMYLSIMLCLHLMVIFKFLTILGVDIDLKKYSKTQESFAIGTVFLFFFIRYYFVFNPVKFEKKHGFSGNYKSLITYTVVFFVSFWILILNF